MVYFPTGANLTTRMVSGLAANHECCWVGTMWEEYTIIQVNSGDLYN